MTTRSKHSHTKQREPAVRDPPGSSVGKRQKENQTPSSAREPWTPAGVWTTWRGNDSSRIFRADHENCKALGLW